MNYILTFQIDNKQQLSAVNTRASVKEVSQACSNS